jgi:hypothetical protein
MSYVDGKFNGCNYNYWRINTYTNYPKIAVMTISTHSSRTNNVYYNQRRQSTNNDALYDP